jgi:hypothetical protein
VASLGELATEYEKRVNDLTAKGWDQNKFQVILSWYQKELTRLSNPPAKVVDTKQSGFPTGIVFGGKLFFKNFYS